MIQHTEALTHPKQELMTFENSPPESEESEEEDIGDIVSHRYVRDGRLLTDNLCLKFRDRHGKLTNQSYREVRRVERHHQYMRCHKALNYINASTHH